MFTSHIKGRVVRIEVTRPEDSRVLVIETERTSGFSWEFPGGKVEPHETVKQAAHRELYEETKLKMSLRLVRYRKRAIPHDPNIISEHFMFTGLYQGGSIELESKHATYRWNTRREALHACPDWWTKHYLSSILHADAT